MRRLLPLLLLAGVLAGPASGHAATTQYAYATMSDGVKIALAISFPPTYDPANPGAHTYPATLGMTGYTGSMDPPGVSNKYVQINASHRGTGCSGGQLDPFSDRVARDGYEIIENWIVQKPWSNGDVGVNGGSWGGLNALLIASTAPPHLRVVTASGVVDDLYRDIAYPGGIANYGFPLLWGAAREVPETEQKAIEGRAQSELNAGDPTCAANIASRTPHAPFPLQAAARPFDDDYWRGYSLYTRVANIQAPAWIGHTWQDSGTGPSGLWLWTRITSPKRLALSNGDHGSSNVDPADRAAWTDCWLLLHGVGCPGDITDPARRVRVYLETTGPTEERVLNEPIVSSDFPLPEAMWERIGISTGALPVATERAFTEPTTLAGPLAATVWISSDTPDADVYVAVVDVSPSGEKQYLQRGLLRASHRALDPGRSLSVGGELIRPRHMHTPLSVSPLVPGEPTRLDIEVWPVAHVFRSGHRMRVEVSPVPGTDSVGGSYNYATVSASGVRVLAGSSLLAPFLPAGPVPASEPACGEQTGITCVPGSVDPEPGRIDSGVLVAGGLFANGGVRNVVSASLANGVGTMSFRAAALSVPTRAEYSIVLTELRAFEVDGSTVLVRGRCRDVEVNTEVFCEAVFTDGAPDRIVLTVGARTYEMTGVPNQSELVVKNA